MSAPDPQYVAIRQEIEDATAADPAADVTELLQQLHARYLAMVRGGSTVAGLPYPDPTDPLMEGADAIRALAEAIPATTTGRVDMGDVAGGATASRTITFPVGMFTEAPTVTTTPQTGYPSSRGKATSATTPSATSATIYAFYDSAGSATAPIVVMWQAVAVSPASALLRLGADDAPAPDITVTCPTTGCSNEGLAIPVLSSWTDEEGNTETPGGFVCGVCGADITETAEPITT